MNESAEPSAPLKVSQIVGNGMIPMSPSSPMMYFESLPLVRLSGKKSGPYQDGDLLHPATGRGRVLVEHRIHDGLEVGVHDRLRHRRRRSLSLNRSEPTLSKAALILGSVNVILWLIQSW